MPRRLVMPLLPPEGPATLALAKTIYRQAVDWRAEHDTPDAARLVARAQDWLAVHFLPTHGFVNRAAPDPAMTAIEPGRYTQIALWQDQEGGDT